MTLKIPPNSTHRSRLQRPRKASARPVAQVKYANPTANSAPAPKRGRRTESPPLSPLATQTKTPGFHPTRANRSLGLDLFSQAPTPAAHTMPSKHTPALDLRQDRSFFRGPPRHSPRQSAQVPHGSPKQRRAYPGASPPGGAATRCFSQPYSQPKLPAPPSQS